MNTRVQAAEQTVERATRVLMDTYSRQPVTLVEGRGVWARDSEGREHIDLVAGIAVNVLGHAHPALVRTLAEQASRLVHTSNLYYTNEQLDLADLLVGTAFPSRVFLCNSGAEATEAALKLARKWGKLRRHGAYEVICMEGSFHGRTMGALAATSVRRYQEPFEPLPQGFIRAPFNDVAAVSAAIDDSVCALLLEPVQGESGIHPLAPGVLRQLRDVCDRKGILLILDEVQSGMGRTGRWWAHQHEGVVPNILTSAKGLAGGLPVGAVLAGPRADVFEPGDHGSTFGGNPLAAAVAATVITTIERDRLVENAAVVGDHLGESLLSLRAEGFPVTEVRGRGLMLAVGLSDDVAPQVGLAALRHGVIVNAIGTRTLRIVPPLVISREEVDEAVRRLRLALADVSEAAA